MYGYFCVCHFKLFNNICYISFLYLDCFCTLITKFRRMLVGYPNLRYFTLQWYRNLGRIEDMQDNGDARIQMG